MMRLLSHSNSSCFELKDFESSKNLANESNLISRMNRIVKISLSSSTGSLINSTTFPVTKKIDVGIEVSQAEHDFDRLIKNIKAAVKKGLYLNNAYIEEKFQINKHLQSLPENRRQEKSQVLTAVISQAFINRQLSSKRKLMSPSKDEISLLNFLGISTNKPAYFDKEYLHLKLKANIDDEFEGFENISLEEIGEKIDNFAMRTRLKEVGIIDEQQVNKFQLCLKAYKRIKDELSSQSKTYPLALPDDFPLLENSINLQNLNRNFAKGKLRVNYLILKSTFSAKTVVELFHNPEVTEQSVEAHLKKAEFLKFSSNPVVLEKCWLAVRKSKKIENSIAFLMKWGPYLKAELIQGFEDKNECLASGVCWGMTQRMRLQAQENNALNLEEFSREVYLKPLDRYLQALGKCNKNLARGKGTGVPQKLLDKYHYEEDKFAFSVRRLVNGEFLEGIQDQLNQSFRKTDDFKKSNGWSSLVLFMKGNVNHAILMRVCENSPERPKCAWLVDPNFGLFSFEEGRSFEEAKALHCDFLNDLIRINYPGTVEIIGNQLIKKNV